MLIIFLSCLPISLRQDNWVLDVMEGPFNNAAFANECCVVAGDFCQMPIIRIQISV